jgi:hypothetical protein
MMREGEARCSALEAKIAALQSAMEEFRDAAPPGPPPQRTVRSTDDDAT